MPVPPITVFSDFACPYCYLTEEALRRVVAPTGGEVRYRAVELYPAPDPLPEPVQDPAWPEHLLPLAAEMGVPLRLPGFRPRTRKAHEAARFAAEHGREAEMRALIHAAYWEAGRDIGRIDVLAELAGRCGLDPTDARIALDIDRHHEAVLADQRLALRLRLTTAPTLYLGTGAAARVLIGLQSPAALDEAIRSR